MVGAEYLIKELAFLSELLIVDVRMLWTRGLARGPRFSESNIIWITEHGWQVCVVSETIWTGSLEFID